MIQENYLFHKKRLLKPLALSLIFKRSMLSVTSSATARVLWPKVYTPRIRINRRVSYFVDNSDASKSSHELAQKNPFLKKKWVSGSTDNSYHHPPIGRIVCNIPGCPNKLCDTPCGTEKENVHVGHATHANYPGSQYISSSDFNKQPRSQYGVFYEPPVKNRDTEGKNRNIEKTKELNNNKDAQAMIHIHSAKNSPDNDDI
jgi:hypothetical protein